MKKKQHNKRDNLIIAIILSIVIIVNLIWPLIFNQKGNYGKIMVDGMIVEYVDLSIEESQIFEYEGVVITFDGKGHIFISETDCPDKLCLNAGKIKNVGQSIICLPNKVTIQIVGDDGYDIVIG